MRSPDGISRRIRPVAMCCCATVMSCTLLAGCGAVTIEHESDGKSSGVGAQLPADVRSAGVLTFATDDEIAPFAFVNDGKIEGSTYELAQAIGKKLGVKIKVVSTKFGSLITTLQSQRADFSGGDFTDTQVREKVVTMVDYEKTDHRVLVRAGNPGRVHGLGDICGRQVGSSTGGLDAQIENEQSARCVKAGNPAAKVKLFDSPADAVVALEAGRLDAVAEEDQPGAYASRTTHKVEQVGAAVSPGLHGFAVLRSRQQLAKAIQSALNSLIADGTYQRILDKWDAGKTRLPHATLNGANS